MPLSLRDKISKISNIAEFNRIAIKTQYRRLKIWSYLNLFLCEYLYQNDLQGISACANLGLLKHLEKTLHTTKYGEFKYEKSDPFLAIAHIIHTDAINRTHNQLIRDELKKNNISLCFDGTSMKMRLNYVNKLKAKL